MPVTTDELGRLVLTDHPATRGLAGRVFARREAKDDAADLIRVLGTTVVGSVHDQRPALVVECFEFGAVPDDWSAAIETFELDGFADEHREVNEAELAALAAESALASKQATKASESSKRISPWRRS